MVWDGVLAPPSSLDRVLGGICFCHPQPEFEGGLSPPGEGRTCSWSCPDPAPMPGTPWSRCVASAQPWVMQWGEMWGEM